MGTDGHPGEFHKLLSALQAVEANNKILFFLIEILAWKIESTSTYTTQVCVHVLYFTLFFFIKISD